MSLPWLSFFSQNLVRAWTLCCFSPNKSLTTSFDACWPEEIWWRDSPSRKIIKRIHHIRIVDITFVTSSSSLCILVLFNSRVHEFRVHGHGLTLEHDGCPQLPSLVALMKRSKFSTFSMYVLQNVKLWLKLFFSTNSSYPFNNFQRCCMVIFMYAHNCSLWSASIRSLCACMLLL